MRAMAHWIFQAVPEKWRLREALENQKDIDWRVTRYQHEIRTGDDVFIWQSGRDAGIYAVAETLDEPHWMSGFDQYDSPSERPQLSEPHLGVRLAVRHFLLDTPISKRAIRRDPELQDLSILKFTRGTQFRVTSQEAQRLQSLGGLLEPDSRAAIERLEKFNEVNQHRSAKQLRRIVSIFERPSEPRQDLIDIVGHTCQVCGVAAFRKSGGGRYVEAHHIEQLADRTQGNLRTDNVLVVCPTCHKKLHFAAVEVVATKRNIKLTINGDEFDAPRNTIEQLRLLKK